MKLLLLVGCLLPAAALALEFVVTDSRLPSPLERQSAVYDGDDTIYLIGGYNRLHQDAVLKYTLSSGAVERVGTFVKISAGGAFLYNGQIVYVGGKEHLEGYSADVYSYNTQTNSFAVVSQLPLAIRSLILAYDATNEVAYSFGGINNNAFTYHDLIMRLDPATSRVEQVGRLPEGRGGGSAVFADDGKAYIFGGTVPINHEAFSNEILRFDPAQNTVVKLGAQLPSLVYYSPAVLAKGQIYIAGHEQLIRFNPASEQVEELQVAGWPNYLLAAASVYVPKLDRIYFFGGYGRFTTEFPVNRVEISYLDLSF